MSVEEEVTQRSTEDKDMAHDYKTDKVGHAPGQNRSFSAPDKDTCTFVFIKSKYGVLRVAEFVFSLLCWNLSLTFKCRFKNEDGSLIAFFLFAAIVSWLYSMFSLALSLVVMKRRSHDLARRIVLTCCNFTCAVFCFITSSLVADYIRILNEADWPCKGDSTCNYLISSVLCGYFGALCFVLDAWCELYVLQEIKKTAIISRTEELQFK